MVCDVIIDNRIEVASHLDLGEETNICSEGLLFFKAFEKWGVDFCKKIYGEFSYIIINKVDGSVILGRDHTGNRRLFYSIKNDHLLGCGPGCLALLTGKFNLSRD